MGQRIELDKGHLVEALRSEGSVNAAARLFGVHPCVVKREARRYGLTAPNAPRTAEDVLGDMEEQQKRAEARTTKAKYKDALERLQEYEDVCAVLAARYADPLPVPKLSPVKVVADNHSPARSVVLLLSDWQIGELVRDTDCGGLNAYDWPTFEARLGRWLEGAVQSVSLQRNAYRITDITVALLGDIVEGHDIYSGQAWHLDKDAGLQVVDGAPLFAQAITYLRSCFPEVPLRVYCVPGNHGKPGGRKGGATPSTFNFDFMLYHFLKAHLVNVPLADFAIEPAGRLLFDVAGHLALMTHGDEVRGWGGLPYYGLDKAQAKLLQELDTVFTYWLLGHHHQAASIPSGRGMRVINGNAVGANQLTNNAVLGATMPSQSLLYFSRGMGLAEHAYIHLSPGSRPEVKVYGV